MMKTMKRETMSIKRCNLPFIIDVVYDEEYEEGDDFVDAPSIGGVGD
jgi:hypothetical protein